MQSGTFAHLVCNGTTNPPVVGLVLCAGPLTLTYVEGALRYIKYGDEELLRMVYVAVRDRNWDTVQPTLHIVRQEVSDNAFELQITASFRKDGIVFDATYHIVGTANGSIRFELSGVAGSSFLKNRIGFCVLHPILGCKGMACEVTQPSGERYVANFPTDISPQQPFKQISGMKWQTAFGTDVCLTAEGDVFETEDQRNWTDASYKTYCTPLDMPFPVRVADGEKINQTICFSIRNKALTIARRSGYPTVSIGHECGRGYLSAGLDLGEQMGLQGDAVKQRIAALRLDHLRVTINLKDAGWRLKLDAALAACADLRIKLFIALFADQSVDMGFLKRASAYTDWIGYVLLLTAGHKTTTDDTVRSWLGPLRERLPEAWLGVGTDAYFAELNRFRPEAAGFDFVSFSINPQVHAFDHASIVETLEAQREVVHATRKLYPGKPIFVSPVTLRPRYNPNATVADIPQSNQLPDQVDSRQGSLFVAGWTIGSMAALVEAGVYGACYYEPVGERGLFFPQNWVRHPLFPAYPTDFAVMAIFEFLGNLPADAVVQPVTVSEPLTCSALAFKAGKRTWLLLANHTHENCVLELENGNGLTHLKQLNAQWFTHVDWLKLFWAASPSCLDESDSNILVELSPFGIVLMASDKRDLQGPASQ